MKRAIVVVAVLGAAGCGTVGDVVPAGKDTYMVRAEMSDWDTLGRIPSWSDAAQLALKRANEHCNSIGRYMSVQKWKILPSRSLYVVKTELTFECKADSDAKKP